ncbi:hypothetical protein [Aquisphaera insulae]|nr:hypothetical protein [Aquisphaera insulae]
MKSLLRGPVFPDPKITVISLAGKGLERVDVKHPKILVGLSISLPDEDVL